MFQRQLYWTKSQHSLPILPLVSSRLDKLQWESGLDQTEMWTPALFLTSSLGQSHDIFGTKHINLHSARVLEHNRDSNAIIITTSFLYPCFLTITNAVAPNTSSPCSKELLGGSSEIHVWSMGIPQDGHQKKKSVTVTEAEGEMKWWEWYKHLFDINKTILFWRNTFCQKRAWIVFLKEWTKKWIIVKRWLETACLGARSKLTHKFTCTIYSSL